MPVIDITFTALGFVTAESESDITPGYIDDYIFQDWEERKSGSTLIIVPPEDERVRRKPHRKVFLSFEAANTIEQMKEVYDNPKGYEVVVHYRYDTDEDMVVTMPAIEIKKINPINDTTKLTAIQIKLRAKKLNSLVNYGVF